MFQKENKIKHILAFFLCSALVFADTEIAGGNPVKDVSYEDCKKSTKQDTCQCITLATRETVCSMASIPVEDAATQNQKFVIGWNKVTLPYTDMQKKVFEKSFASLDNSSYKTNKEMIASMYLAEEESLDTFRTKIREQIDLDIGKEKDPTGDPNATETLEDVVKRIKTSNTNAFLKNMATQYSNQLKELEQNNANTSAIDSGNVILNLIIKAVMALSGMDIGDSTKKAIENSYIGKVKLPFCIVNRYYEFDLNEDKDTIKTQIQTDNYDSALSGTGFNFGTWNLPTSSMEKKSYNGLFKLGTKVNLQGLLEEDSNGETYQNTMIINALIGNELSWATSMVNQSFIYDQYANVSATLQNPVVESGTGLRKVMINRGDLRNSALNMFNAGRSLLTEPTRESFKINCTPTIISQKGSKVLVQEYDIPRPGDSCQSDETAYCPITEYKYYASNGQEGKNHNVWLTVSFPRGLTMQCSATEYSKKVQCPGFISGKNCTIRWRDCYTLKKYYDYAVDGINSNDNRCIYSKRYNNWSDNSDDMQYYTGFHDLVYTSESNCKATGALY
ncbi:hypothetical protein CQA57_05765 [Helicobacter anseris]|uniref:Uncharacterized protein n=1 Tax=Helicobacter anseris TaxID=375926 RepID=A0A3D8J6H8_9HELI|nr:hypothetical protein [Helicobacter anseris]RDU73032.1 hypothetical protein CQA57_05765 [Helicobacter anseris]